MAILGHYNVFEEEKIPRGRVSPSRTRGFRRYYVEKKNLTALLRRRRRADCRGVPAARRVRVATDKSRIIGVYPMRCIPFVFTRRDLTSHTHTHTHTVTH